MKNLEGIKQEIKRAYTNGCLSIDDVCKAIDEAADFGYYATHAREDSPEGKIEELEKEVEELERDNASLKNEVDSLNDQIGVLKSEGADSADEASDHALANILAGRGYLGILTRCETLNVGE